MNYNLQTLLALTIVQESEEHTYMVLQYHSKKTIKQEQTVA